MKTESPVSPAAEKGARATHSGQPAHAEVKDADSTASKPQGTLADQVKTMESEGQAQPQADEVPPEERTSSIPPLPEPNVEGVGKESGPSAGKTHETIARKKARQRPDANR